MVLYPEIDSRRQRILRRREQARQEFIAQQQLRESEETKNETKEENPPETANLDAEVEGDKKKQKLDVLPDSNTMISNVYHYLDQEYKYLQLMNDNDPDLRSLAAITRRTSDATGVTRSEVRTIVREERVKRTERRKAERQKQRTTSTERKSNSGVDGTDNNYY